MTPEQKADFKRRLEEERRALEAQLGSMGVKDEAGEWTAGPGEIDQSATEPDELADRMEQQEENAEEIAALSPRLKEVNDALEKMKEGTYGVCEECNEPIEEARLEANPAARTCTAHL